MLGKTAALPSERNCVRSSCVTVGIQTTQNGCIVGEFLANCSRSTSLGTENQPGKEDKISDFHLLVPSVPVEKEEAKNSLFDKMTEN